MQANGKLKVIKGRVQLSVLLSSFLMLQTSIAAYGSKEMEKSESTEISSQGSLPALSANAEDCWLESINSKSSDDDPLNIESNRETNIETGAIAAIMPATMSAPASGVPQAAGSRGVQIAAAGDSFSSGRIAGNPSADPTKVEELTRQILLKEIALEKFNLNYKLNAGKQGRFKGWRYTGLNEINGGFGLAGGIISMYNRGVHLHRSSMVKTYVQEDANWLPMIGNIVGAGAAVIEAGINEYHDYQAYTKGFSPGKAREHVNSLKTDINRMMAEREQLVRLEQSAPLLNGRVEVDEIEGKVLTDLRDQSLLEYQRFHLAARRLLAFQQSSYFFDFAKNVTSAIGYDFAYLSLHRHRRPWNGRAGTLFDVAGGLQILEPVACRVFAKGVSEYHRHYVHDTIKEAEAKEASLLEKDQKQLDAVCKNGKYGMDTVGEAVQRTAYYGDHSKIFQDELQNAAKQLQKAKLVAGENTGAGVFMGGSKLAAGILFNACGYPQLYNRAKGQTPSRVTNHLLFAASAAGTPGTCFGMLDSLRIQLQGEINRHRLAAGGNLPGQLIKKRLAQLDAMESKLNSSAHWRGTMPE